MLACSIALQLVASLSPCEPCSYPSLNDTIVTGLSIPNLLAFSSQGCLAVGDSTANTILIYRLDAQCRVIGTGVPITAAQGLSSPLSIAFSPNGSCLVVANFGNNTVTAYALGPNCELLNNGQPISFVSNITSVNKLAVSPTGCIVATTSSDNVYTGSIDEDSCSLTLEQAPFSASGIVDVAFSADGNCIAFASSLGNAVFISSASQTCNPLFLDQALIPVPAPLSLTFSSSNCLAIASSTTDSVVLHASTASPGFPCGYSLLPRATITTGIASPIRIAISPNNCLAVVNFPSTFRPTPASVTLYSINPDCTVNNGGAPVRTIAVANPFTLAFSPDGTCLAITDLSESTGRVLLYSATPLMSVPVVTDVFSTCLGAIVFGTAVPGAQVTVFVNNIPRGTATANSAGLFVVSSIALSSGVYCFTAADTQTECTSAPLCKQITVPSCILALSNLAFNSHCTVR